ncbi:MAG: hypothetical protein WBA17_17535, partial [Saprospiraceae bacterium]
MNAKKIVLLAVLMQLGVVCFGQIFYSIHHGNSISQLFTQRHLTRDNLTDCSIYQDTVPANPYTATRGKALAIDENGLFFGTTFQTAFGPVYFQLMELTTDDPVYLEYGPATIPAGGGNLDGVVSIGNSEYYLFNYGGYNTHFNIETQVSTQLSQTLNGNTGDSEFIDGFIYRQWLVTGIFNTLLKVDPVSGAFVDTIFLDNPPVPLQGVIGGLASQWKTDCSGKQLIVPTFRDTVLADDPLTSYKILFLLIDPAFPTEIERVVCPAPVKYPSQTLFDMASWETHRQVCEVRLDLDEDDSQGRAGPHYRNADKCAQNFPLADDDITIWTIDDRPVDSVYINISDFGSTNKLEYLSIPASPDFTAEITNDTLIRIYPLTLNLSYADWESYLSQTRLEIPAGQPFSVRAVEFFLYAGGLRADGARSYVNYQANTVYAGEDQTIYTCRSGPVGEDALNPSGVTAGGRWEPALYYQLLRDENSLGFDPKLLEYGTFRYIVEPFSDCGG